MKTPISRSQAIELYMHFVMNPAQDKVIIEREEDFFKIEKFDYEAKDEMDNRRFSQVR